MERIHIIRHGVTKWNAEGRAQGRCDIPLSAEGIDQVAEFAGGLRELGITRIVTSPLKRAKLSAGIISDVLGNIPIELHEGLVERSLGDYEGRLVDELKKEFGDACFEQTPPNGESSEEFKNRIIAAFNDIVEGGKEDTTLMVCHGWVISVLDSHLRPDAEDPRYGYDVKNSTLYTYDLKGS